MKRSIFYNEIAINWSPSYHLISPIGRDALRNHLTPSILVRKSARSAPEALTISPRGRPKFQTRSPNGRLKLMILRITSCEWTTKFPAHSALLKQKRKTFGLSAVGEKIFPPIKGKQTSACLEIRFWDFRWSAVEVWALNWRRHFVNFWTNGGSLP